MNPMEPNREVYREREVQYNPVPRQPVEPVVQPVYPPVQPVYTNPPVYPVDQGVAETNQYVRGDVNMETGRKMYMDRDGNMVEREDQIFEDPRMARQNVLDRTAQIIYFITGVIEILLLIRFLFRLFGAGASGLVNLIYGLTGPLVAPLNGIFNDQNLTHTSVLEISTLLAMVLWALIGWGIVKLLYIVLEPSPNTRSVYTKSRTRRLQ